MSTVYLAQDEVLDRPVAVKLLHREISEEPDQLERFRREARAAARLSHPNLVSVIDAGEDEGRPYIVFEYVEGDTLKRRSSDRAGCEVDEAVAYAIEIGRGLIAAHGRKLVHRDVKPQNVLIDPDGRAKVTDFGIARSLESEGLTATGRVLGTTDYVSPEQAMGEDVDERSDVYSLGIVLYEMLTGDVPFQRRDPGRRRDEARERADARRPGRAPRRLGRRRVGRGPLDHQGPARPLQLGRRDGPGPGGDPRGRGRPRRRHRRRGDHRPRLGAAARSDGSRAAASRAPAIAWGMLGIGLIAAALIFGGDQLEAWAATTPADGGDEVALVEAGAEEFDPSPGDGKETEHRRSLAVDGDPTGTAWATEHYDTEDFGGIKDGVGLVVEAQRARDAATAIEIRRRNLGLGRRDLRHHGRAARGPRAAGDSRSATVTDGGTRETIDLDGGPRRPRS